MALGVGFSHSEKTLVLAGSEAEGNERGGGLQVGVHVNDTGEKVGTVALAYAAHKALSPVRFPPTVALTPIVASWFGKKPAAVADPDHPDESSQ
jgi:hypothetical protein